ncbi:MAG: MBL fold metallo-hydrolase [Clostridia bacterium]|nr:MBL fold metallo-hydrolase [Clostridia bacterium]
MFKKVLIISAVVIVCAAIITGIILFRNLTAKQHLNAKLNGDALPDAPQTPEKGRDCIHFLRTGTSDAILLESDGHFAMVDSGEDTDNPRNFPSLNLPGYEQEVLAYLKAHAADENGKVHLDFVLGTHSHSDHIGGFDTILADPDITVDRAYLKPYDSSKIKENEITEWDNQEVYDQMVQALQARGVPIISKPDSKPFAFGNLTLTLINTVDPVTDKKVGENDQSLCLLIEKNGTRVFLAADLDNKSGDERRLAPQIGKIDLLKVGHHSYGGSSSSKFIATLSPAVCVITNNFESVDRKTLTRIERICQPSFYITGKENGILAVLGDNGAITYYGQIQK